MRFCLVYLLLWLSRSLAAETAETTRSLNGPDASETIPGQYIVVFDEEKMKASGQSVGTLATSLATEVGVTVKHTYDILISGFSIKDGDDKAVKRLLENSMIKDVVPNIKFTPSGGNQTEFLHWGLDRIDDYVGRDGSFEYPDNPGEGVDIYIMDSGINAYHPEFVGRLAPDDEHINFIDDSQDPFWNDCAGHGSFVASMAAGAFFGVAKSATLHAVRIFDCDMDSVGLDDGIAGLAFVAYQCQSGGKLCVINMSFSTGFSDVLNYAVAAMVDMGVVAVSAAGNDYGLDSCVLSPASEEKVINVGATNFLDQVADFSNLGPCVDVFAPGVDLPGATAGCTDCFEISEGTSFAAPLVAGVAALILQDHAANGYTTDPAAVKHRLLSDAAAGVITGLDDESPNLFLQMNTPFVSAPPSAAPTETPQPTDIFSEEPTMAPTETHSPTGAPTVLVCEEGQDKVEVILETDQFASETSFTLTETCKGEELVSVPVSELENRQTYSYAVCVGFGRFVFEISDSRGDGLNFPGHYQILVNGEEIAYGFYFQLVDTFVFGDDDCITPAPTSSSPPSMSPSESLSPTSSGMPSMAPSLKPTNLPTLAPTFTSCGDGLRNLVIELQTDDFGFETSFTLFDNCDDGFFSSPALESESLYRFQLCLRDHEHSFVIFDSAGDGIFFPGFIRLYLDGEIILDDPDFGSEYEFTFLDDCASEMPSVAPPEDCGKGENELELEVHTDLNAHETSFKIENICNGDTVLSVDGGTEMSNLELYKYRLCLPREVYRLTVSDSWGDGLLDPGYVLAMYDGSMIVNKPNFDDTYVMSFGGECPPPPPKDEDDDCPCNQKLLPLLIACKLRKPLQCLVPFL